MATVQRKLVHKQFNSPIGLYSDENVKETLDRELRVISNGALGIETSDQHRPVNLSNSAVLKMLEEQEGERISGYKRVAWPPVSEGTAVKGSTPQPQQPQYQGGQNYYSQPTQPQYPQQKYGGHSPQPHQQQQPAQYYQQQHHQPRQDSNLYHQQQQPSYPEQSYSRPQSGQQLSEGFRPVQSSTVAFSGGAAQKYIPSLPGQPHYPPAEQPLPAPIVFPQVLSSYDSGEYGSKPQYPQSPSQYPQNQPQYIQTQPTPQQNQPQWRSDAQSSPQTQHHQNQYGAEPQSPYLVSPSGQKAEPLVGTNPPRGWSHVSSPTPTRTGYTQGPPKYQSSANLPPFGSESHFGPHQPQSQQLYESPVNHQPSYGQQCPQQKYSDPQQQYYPQGQQTQYQFDRGQSPGVIQLRKEAPVSQQPAPVVTSQPAARRFKGGSNMRGDLKWPPPEVKAQMEAEEEQQRNLAKGPAIRPRRVHKDYTQFFAKHALNSTYPGYKVPPGTQHVYVEF